MEFSIAMALVDFLPVLFFGIAAAFLQHDLYYHLGKGPFALFSAGTINVFCAGFLKAAYKLLYALGICDFQVLSAMFFPVQSIGFLLAGLGVTPFLFGKKKNKVFSVAVVPPVFSGTFVFVAAMCLGLGMMDLGIAMAAGRKKMWKAVVCLALAFLCSLCMGYLSSRDFSGAMMNWIAEGVNVVGQGAFLTAALLLHRCVLGQEKE